MKKGVVYKGHYYRLGYCEGVLGELGRGGGGEDGS